MEYEGNGATNCKQCTRKNPQRIYKVELATVVEGDQKATFSIATRSRGGRYSFPWIALLYT